MKRSNVPHFEILGAPIGDPVFCAVFGPEAVRGFQVASAVRSCGFYQPRRQCGSYFRLVHLSRNTPTPLVKKAFALFDDCVQQCFSECTAADASASTWQQAQQRLKRGDVGFRSLSCHSSAVYIASSQSSGLSPLSGKYLSSSVDLYNSLIDPQDSLTPELVGNFHLSQKVLSSKIEDR